MECFVSGGAGFIGSHRVDRLMEKGNYVRVFDNRSSGKLDLLTQYKKNKKFKFVQVDLVPLTIASLKNHDIVVHSSANPDARLGIKFCFNCEKINALGWQARYRSDEVVQMTVNALVKEVHG